MLLFFSNHFDLLLISVSFLIDHMYNQKILPSMFWQRRSKASSRRSCWCPQYAKSSEAPAHLSKVSRRHLKTDCLFLQ